APNGIVGATANWVGTGQFETLTDSSAPLLTTPTQLSTLSLAVADATIRLGSEDIAYLTSLSLTIDIAPSRPDVCGGPDARYAPDVFAGSMTVAIEMEMLREDLTKIAAMRDETPLSLHVLMVENESEPKDFLSCYVPNLTLGGVAKSALAKAGGARTQS